MFAIALHISYPKGVLNLMSRLTLYDKTARPSQKKRYETVAQLPRDHLTYTDGEIQVTPISTVWCGSQQRSPTQGGRSSTATGRKGTARVRNTTGSAPNQHCGSTGGTPQCRG